MNFDDEFDVMSKVIVAVWIVGAICSLGLTGAIIWGIVQVVQALTH